MDATLKALLLSLLVAPFWMLFEYLILTGVGKCIHGKEGSEAPKKMASAMTTACSHFVQLVMWWVVVLKGGLTRWAFDIGNWAPIMLPRPWDITEREILVPFFTIYFGFAWHSLIKDLRRNWPPKSPDQFSFLLHHLLTIGLVAGCFKVGAWRADIFLYSSKFYQGLYDQGRGRLSIITFLYILNNVVWGGTRVLLYGFFSCFVLTKLCIMIVNAEYDLVTTIVCVALYVASLLMWLLQVIWLWHLIKATRKFLRSKGKDTHDHLDVGQLDADKGKPLVNHMH